MPDSPYISDPGWTCTITAGSATVPVSGVVAHLMIQAGDHLIGAAGGGLAIGSVTAGAITLLRPAPAAEAGAGIPLIVERGPWRAMPAAAAIVSREVYERMQIAASDGRSLPVISILNTPPASPAHGDRYLIGTSPTGAWAGRANSVAEWSDVVGGWVYAAPVAGWSVTINGSRLRYQYGGGAWGTAQMSAADVIVTPTGGILSTDLQTHLQASAARRARNYAINGDFDVWQAGTSGVSGYGPDCSVLSGTTWWQQSSDVPGGSGGWSLEFGNAAAGSFPSYRHRIEAAAARDLYGKEITISIMAKNIAGTANFTINAYSANAENNFSAVTWRSGIVVAASMSASWTRYTFKTTLSHADFRNGLSLEAVRNDISASTTRIKRLAVVVGDATQVDDPFSARDPATELLLCSRYYETGRTSSSLIGFNNLFATTVPFKVPKVKIPTVGLTINYKNPGSSNPYASTLRTSEFSLRQDTTNGSVDIDISWTADARL